MDLVSGFVLLEVLQIPATFVFRSLQYVILFQTVEIEQMKPTVVNASMDAA